MKKMKPLIDLLRHCTVRIVVRLSEKKEEGGTGFFVAPQLILTCSHVVKSARDNQGHVRVTWYDQQYNQYSAEALIAEFHEGPYPDLALLKIEQTDHPCVYLDVDEEIDLEDKLYTYSYPYNHPKGESTTLKYEGPTDFQQPLHKFKAGRVIPGMSGAPLLNLRTGKVCGIVQSTLDTRTPLGCRAIPSKMIFQTFSGLGIEDLQQKFHQQDRRWTDYLNSRQNKREVPQGVWYIPYQRNPFFTGREKLLKRIHDTFTSSGTASAQPQALNGLSGIGKTQIALEYAYRFRDDYHYVFWVQADKRQDLIQDFVTIADLLNLREKDTKDQDITVAAVKRWLEEHLGWLLILDTADDLEMVRDYLPTGGKGHILLTTRAQAVGTLAKGIEIDKMGPKEGALFLLHRARVLEQEASLENASTADRAKAMEIIQFMDGLPLALDQAGAYIEETGCHLSSYVDLYKRSRAKLLKRRGGLVLDHPEPVATTWSISFKKVQKANSAAADLLRLCVFLDPDNIPEEIITKGASVLGCELQPVETDPDKLNEIIEALQRFSLVRRNSTAKTLVIHRLVQAVLKDGMNMDIQYIWIERTIRAINRAFPDVEYTTWPQCQQCLPHAFICVSLIEQRDITFIEATQLLNKIGTYLRESAKYAQAEALYKQAWAIREKTLVPQQVDKAENLNNLAMIYYRQGKYAQAEPLYQQALAIREQALGSEHPKVAESLNDLARLYYKQGQYVQAEPLYQRALAIREQALGPKHPKVAESLNDLARLYYEQGKYAQAEPLYQQALAIRENALGSEHPEVAESLNDLARLYYKQGKYAQAEPLYQQALAIREKTLGPEHPEVAKSLNDLAMLYYRQSKYKQAEPLYPQAQAISEEALAIREQSLGPEHPDVADSLNNLARLYADQGKYAQAEPLCQQALAIREQSLGPEHPDVADSLNNLAMLNYKQGQYVQAEPLYQRALAVREQALGLEHPKVAESLNDLAMLYYEQSKYAQAEPLYQRALAIREQALGSEHPDVAESLNDLAMLYYEQSKYAQAEPLYQRALAIREQALGSEHPDVAESLNDLAMLYYEQGQYVQAEPLYQRALAIREQALGSEHPDVAESLNDLAMLYYEQGQYVQAEPLYQRALAIREQALGSEHPDVAESLNDLARLYYKQGRYVQAEPLYQRALAIREQALGSEHPDVAESLNDLAMLYYEQGQYAQAEPLYQRALRISVEVLGSEHPDVAIVMKNYANLLRKTNRKDKAAGLEVSVKEIEAKHILKIT